MNTTQEQKSLLRKKIIFARKGLTDSEIEEKSVIITRKLVEMSQVANAHRVLLYLPVNGEVDTKYVLAHSQRGGSNIFLPSYLKEEKKWVVSNFKHKEDLEIGPLGIMQPRRASAYPLSSLDLAIVPVVAFSAELTRLGYGLGVYDRLIRGLKITKIGLAYEFQLVETLSAEAHDLKMDYVVTEKKIYTGRPMST